MRTLLLILSLIAPEKRPACDVELVDLMDLVHLIARVLHPRASLGTFPPRDPPAGPWYRQVLSGWLRALTRHGSGAARAILERLEAQFGPAGTMSDFLYSLRQAVERLAVQQERAAPGFADECSVILLNCLSRCSLRQVFNLSYPCRWLVALLNQRGIGFCMRVEKAGNSGFACVRDFLRSGLQEQFVTLPTPSKGDAEDYECGAHRAQDLLPQNMAIKAKNRSAETAQTDDAEAMLKFQIVKSGGLVQAPMRQIAVNNSAAVPWPGCRNFLGLQPPSDSSYFDEEG